MLKTPGKYSIIKEIVREKIDPYDLFEYYDILIPKRFAGAEQIRIPCPIHDGDGRTSFSFDMNTKHFTCFSHHCGENEVNRDLYVFIKLMEEKKAHDEGRVVNASFVRCLSIAAKIAGVSLDEIEKISSETIERVNNNKWAREIMSLSDNNDLIEFDENQIEIFRAQLPLAYDYIYTRGFDDQILDLFEIGYSPDGVDEEFLAKRNDFPGRIIFPTRDSGGTLVGWVGRIAMSGKTRFLKYKVHADFDKGFVLYNYNRAKEYIKEKGEIIIVEGMFDVMRLWSYGIKNVVAVMGSSLTPDQLMLAIESAFKAYVFLDSDGAGREASERICKQLQRYLDTYRVDTLDNKDPDEMSHEEVVKAIKNAKKFID